MKVLKAKREGKPLDLKNRWGVMFQHDNAQHWIAINVAQSLNENVWDVRSSEYMIVTRPDTFRFHLYT